LNVKNILDTLIQNNIYEVNEKKPDPVMIAHREKNEYAALTAALFAYGNVKAIIKFLEKIDYTFQNITYDETLYYRFQSSRDIFEFLKTMEIMKKEYPLYELFMQGFKKEENVIDGIKTVIEKIYSLNPYRSKGYEFLIGKIPPAKTKGVSPYKRWNMFLRWMVRDKYPDMGLWKNIPKNRLIIPLDTHTHKTSLKLGLLKRKTYDLQAAVELTEKLITFDRQDPLKYDFALYRIGQMNIKL